MSVKKRRIVVKIGSSSLTHENGRPNFLKMERLVRVLADVKNSGDEVILVTSGAITVGVSKLNLPQRPESTIEKQATAAVGQSLLMSIYDKLFAEYGYIAAQMLLNADILSNDEWVNNVKNTFEALLKYSTIPIVNENDSISFEEIVFGDNDKLSAIVSNLVAADKLIILTDIDGYYSGNPNIDKNATLISKVDIITNEMIESAGGTASSKGTGGMKSKLIAADLAMKAGVTVHIVNGWDPYIIRQVLDELPVGTTFKGVTL